MARYPDRFEQEQMAREAKAEEERLDSERIDFISEAIRNHFNLEQATFQYTKYAELKRKIEALERRPRGEPMI